MGSPSRTRLTDADAATDALLAAWRQLCEGLGPESRALTRGGVASVVTGVPLAFFNGVFTARPEVRAGAVEAMLDEVAATGLPHCLQLRSGVSPDVERIPQLRGMGREHDIPLMVLDPGPQGPAPAPGVAGCEIRQIEPEEAALHAELVAAGFEMPVSLAAELMRPEVLGLPGCRCYVGDADGRSVVTGFGITHGEFVGVFNIVTLPEYRGRGYGAAITARVVEDGLHAGANRALLQSSEAGYGVYRRLGFRKLEDWQLWVTQ